MISLHDIIQATYKAHDDRPDCIKMHPDTFEELWFSYTGKILTSDEAMVKDFIIVGLKVVFAEMPLGEFNIYKAKKLVLRY